MMSDTCQADIQRTYICFGTLTSDGHKKGELGSSCMQSSRTLNRTTNSSPLVCFAFMHAFCPMLLSTLAGMFIGCLVGTVNRLPVGMKCRNT